MVKRNLLVLNSTITNHTIFVILFCLVLQSPYAGDSSDWNVHISVHIMMQDYVPIEAVKIQVSPAFKSFVHQFSNYSLSNREGASKLSANKI